MSFIQRRAISTLIPPKVNPIALLVASRRLIKAPRSHLLRLVISVSRARLLWSPAEARRLSCIRTDLARTFAGWSDRYNSGHWRCSRCCSYAADSQVLRGFTTRICTRGEASWAFPALSTSIFRQEPVRSPYVYFRSLVSGRANNSSRSAIWHAILVLMAVGYAQNYYFHLRELLSAILCRSALS